MRSLPWQNYKNWTPFCSGEKIFNFSTRDPDHLHALASRAYGAIFSKNRFFGTTHGDKPPSPNGISLRSPSLIMAPAKTQAYVHEIINFLNKYFGDQSKLSNFDDSWMDLGLLSTLEATVALGYASRNSFASFVFSNLPRASCEIARNIALSVAYLLVLSLRTRGQQLPNQITMLYYHTTPTPNPNPTISFRNH